MNCQDCPNHCCGQQPLLAPILLPFEVANFRSEEVTTDGQGEILRLARNPKTGLCIFLDGQRCTIYPRRPWECRLYPYIMSYDLSTRKLGLVLHDGCPRKEQADPPPELPRCLQEDVPERWWRAFESEKT